MRAWRVIIADQGLSKALYYLLVRINTCILGRAGVFIVAPYPGLLVLIHARVAPLLGHLVAPAHLARVRRGALVNVTCHAVAVTVAGVAIRAGIAVPARLAGFDRDCGCARAGLGVTQCVVAIVGIGIRTLYCLSAARPGHTYIASRAEVAVIAKRTILQRYGLTSDRWIAGILRALILIVASEQGQSHADAVLRTGVVQCTCIAVVTCLAGCRNKGTRTGRTRAARTRVAVVAIAVVLALHNYLAGFSHGYVLVSTLYRSLTACAKQCRNDKR